MSGTDQYREARNTSLEEMHKNLKSAFFNARQCDLDNADDKRILEWIEGVLEEFGDDVEDCLTPEDLE